MKPQLDAHVLTPSGKTGRIVETGLPDGGVKVRLDPFLPDWAGQGRGQKMSKRRSRWFQAPPPEPLQGVCAVYAARDLKGTDQED